jgi:hypothetical protein
MREAATNLGVSGGVVGKSTYERGCARRLLILVCLVVQDVSRPANVDV